MSILQCGCALILVVRVGPLFAAEEDRFLNASVEDRVSLVTGPLDTATRSIRVEYRRTIRSDPDYWRNSATKMPDLSHRDSTYLRLDQKTRVEQSVVSYEADPPAQPTESVTTFDGTQERYWLKVGDDQSPVGRAILVERPANSPLEDRILAQMLFVGGVDVESVLRADDLTIDLSDSPQFGSPTVRVAGTVEINRLTYEVRYWLAREMNYLPVSAEVMDPRTGHLTRRQEVERVKEIRPGVWFPTRVSMKGFGNKPGRSAPIQVITYQVNKVEVDPQVDDPAALFNTSPRQLPAGTEVQDRIVDEIYIMPSGPVADKTLTEIAGLLAQVDGQVAERLQPGGQPAAPSVAADAARKEPTPLITPSVAQADAVQTARWLWGGVTFVACIALAVLYHRRRRPRREVP